MGFRAQRRRDAEQEIDQERSRADYRKCWKSQPAAGLPASAAFAPVEQGKNGKGERAKGKDNQRGQSEKRVTEHGARVRSPPVSQSRFSRFAEWCGSCPCGPAAGLRRSSRPRLGI